MKALRWPQEQLLLSTAFIGPQPLSLGLCWVSRVIKMSKTKSSWSVPWQSGIRDWIAPAEQGVCVTKGRPGRGPGSFWADRGESLPKEGAPYARVLRLESSRNAENVSFATHALKPATPAPHGLLWVLPGLKTKALISSLLHGSESWCRRPLSLSLNKDRI